MRTRSMYSQLTMLATGFSVLTVALILNQIPSDGSNITLFPPEFTIIWLGVLSAIFAFLALRLRPVLERELHFLRHAERVTGMLLAYDMPHGADERDVKMIRAVLDQTLRYASPDASVKIKAWITDYLLTNGKYLGLSIDRVRAANSAFQQMLADLGIKHNMEV